MGDPDVIVEDDDFEENQTAAADCEYCPCNTGPDIARLITELPDGTFINHRGEPVCQYCGVAHQPDDPFLGCGM